MDDVIALQDNYIEETDKEYRKSKGQFFTPRWIASGMSRWVVDCNPAQIIDPAFGLRILLDECANQGYKGSLVGFEKDELIAKRVIMHKFFRKEADDAGDLGYSQKPRLQPALDFTQDRAGCNRALLLPRHLGGAARDAYG